MARIPSPGRRVALRRRRHLQRWPPRRHSGPERRRPAADSDAGTGGTDVDPPAITPWQQSASSLAPKAAVAA